MSVTLTLRVSSDKRRPGVKSLSVKEEKIQAIIKKLRSTTSDGPDTINFLDELEKAPDLKAQLDTLRTGIKTRSETENNQEKEHSCCKILVEILLSLELKSPLRSGIIRILKDGRHGSSELVQEVIADGLRGRFLAAASRVSASLDVANTLCGCFDNFPSGAGAAQLCIREAYAFVVSSLNQCLSHGCDSADTELCQCTHALVRAALHLCGLDQTAPEPVADLHRLARQLLSCDWLPLDTRTNCGLLTVTTGGAACWPQMLLEQLSSSDDLTSLCLYSGLISCLTVAQLSVTLLQDKTAIELIFDAVMGIHRRNPLQAVMTLGVARTLVSLSRLLLSDTSPLPPLLPRLLLYVWEHLEHVMDSVKHLASTLLQNIAKMHSAAVDVNGAILLAMRELPLWGRARHVALSTLIGRLPVTALVKDRAEVSRMYLQLGREVISSHAINVIKELMKQHYREASEPAVWREWWVEPLVSELDHAPSVALQQVLATALMVCPDIIKDIVSYPEEKLSVGSRLLCLRQANKLGQLITTADDDGTSWRGLVTYTVLHGAISHPDQQTQLSCLALIVEGPKTTEPFTEEELRLVEEHVRRNLNMETPASRQHNMALLSKFVSRLTGSQSALERHVSPDVSRLLSRYRECCQSLTAACLDCLFPGAAYSRRVTALHLLSALAPAHTPALATPLIACLADSYEDVKLAAVRLLVNTDGLLDSIMSPQTLVRCAERGVTVAGGVKPPECLTAAYLLATVAKCPASSDNLAAFADRFPCCSPFVNNHQPIEHRMMLCCLVVVTDRLVEQVTVATASLLRAACSGPLYGLLFTARLLLSQLNLSDCSGECWRQLISQLVDVSFRCSDAVASVVNSDSPEGHLPMDFDYDLTEVCGGDESEAPTGVTSQMVLLCSWRTVKEVSLLLGFLVQSASIALTLTDEGLLSGEQVLRIGDHLTTLLAQTKHRGAFEQAYVGFSKLVGRLWRFPRGELRELPRQWLEQTMCDINDGGDNLCATRRSAGVPFMLQALICTQLEAEGPAAIEPWIRRLLDMADSPVSPTSTRTHALNILRALFRNTQLGEAVTVFVERAFIITISAFSSNSWMERNSATLLLSALMTRVFGVPRSKDQEDLSWKNKMTGRIFFQRYPKLFGFFRDELRKASCCVSKNSLHPSLYPVLLVLGRLYPSSLEGSDSNIQLAEYIPELRVCAGSNIYKTRTLGASAMAALMTWPHLTSLIKTVGQSDLPANLRHGLLLQISYFLKNSYFTSFDHVGNEECNWIENLKDVFSMKKCFAEIEVVFGIFDILCEKHFHQINNKTWGLVTSWGQHYLKASQSSELNVYCAMRTKICEVLLKLVTINNTEGWEDLCKYTLTDDAYEVRHTVLDYISCLQSDINCSQRFCNFLSNVCSVEVRRRSLSKLVLILDTFVQCFFNTFFKCESETHQEDKAKILMALINWREASVRILEAKDSFSELKGLFFIVDLCKDSHPEVAYTSLLCLSQFIALKGQLEEEEISAICELLSHLCGPESCGLFDELVYNLLKKHFTLLQKSTRPVNRLTTYKTYIELSKSSDWESAVDRVFQSESDDTVLATALAALTLGQFLPNTPDIEEVGRVFEDSGLNDRYEELILSRVCGRRLVTLWLPELISRPLDPSVAEWLTAQTGLQAASLAELTTLARLHALQLDNNLCQFMSQGYQLLRLNQLKLNNFL